MYLIGMGEFGGTAGGCDKKNETRRRGGLSDAAVGVRPCSGPDARLLMKEHRARIVADGTGVFRRVDGESGLRLRDGRKRRHGR